MTSKVMANIRMKGDMAAILEHIPLSSQDDLPRFWTLFDSKIKAGEITKYTVKYEKTKNKVRMVETEMTAEESRTKMDELVHSIKNNSQKRKDGLAALMAKYGGEGAPLSLEEDKRSRDKEKPSKISSKPKKASPGKKPSTGKKSLPK